KTTDKRSYILNSRITGYYKKGQIARYFVPFAQGLHVDGDVVLILMPEENEPVAEFTMKTNLKHGHAGIEDAERVFARDIAEAIVVVVPITPVVVY
ncbi:MAG: hypothetical protein NTX36_07740, partial [Proteobacteria bacterium]|nr:hypothetical protein [Pseudomonadota bacterium]